MAVFQWEMESYICLQVSYLLVHMDAWIAIVSQHICSTNNKYTQVAAVVVLQPWQYALYFSHCTFSDNS